MEKQTMLLRFLGLLLAATILIMPHQNRTANAQSSDDTSWTTPTNLSNSDLTSSPAIISDRTGAVHVVWQDGTLGSMYSKLVDGVWSQPEAVKFPFAGFVPQFVDGGDYIHAFWLPRNGEKLSYSRVAVDKFGTSSGWERARVLANGVEDFQVDYQEEKTLHLAYLTSLEDAKTTAGTYYLRSIDGGVKWDGARPIYTSRYFRSLKPEMVNVDISAAMQDDNNVVYLTWNNPALKKIFFSKSVDGGVTWDVPMEVDGPSPTNTTSSPLNPMVTADGANVLLLWQSNLQSGFACTVYYQWSNDNGATWSEQDRILGEFVGCPQENIFLDTSQGFKLLQTTIRNEVYMLAWDGRSWGKVFPQSTLSGFSDPLTNEPVSFRCRQNTIQSGTTIFVVGCNEVGVIDVWVTSRAVGTVEDWYPLTSIWDDPVVVVESDNDVSSVQAVADIHGVFHVLWRQVDRIEDGRPFRSIFYSRYENNALSQPVRVLASPDNMVEDFSLAYDRSRDRLAVVWTGATTGEIYYSWSDISRATSKFEWLEAVDLPTIHPLIKSPNILITPDGTIHVAYTVPINENRGVYLISSTDGGDTWGQTISVYGVSEKDWQAIDYPIMASSGDEILHMIWRREKVIGDAGIVGLYYALSGDRGQTWTAPQIVSDDQMQGAWIIDGASEGLHRFWLSRVGTEGSFFHDGSMDQGSNWTIQDNLTKFGENPGLASPLIDTNGWVNYAQVVDNSSQSLAINHKRKDDGRWVILNSLMLGSGTVEEITSIAAQSLPDGRLVLAYTFKDLEPDEGEMPYRLFIAAQSGQAIPTIPTVPTSTPSVAPLRTTTSPILTPEPTLSATEPINTPVPTERIPEPSPEIDETAIENESQTFIMDTTTGLALSGGLAFLVVLSVLVYTRIRRP